VADLLWHQRPMETARAAAHAPRAGGHATQVQVVMQVPTRCPRARGDATSLMVLCDAPPTTTHQYDERTRATANGAIGCIFVYLHKRLRYVYLGNRESLSPPPACKSAGGCVTFSVDYHNKITELKKLCDKMFRFRLCFVARPQKPNPLF
jgi:hypothetical protein